jgi:hypothetical protein
MSNAPIILSTSAQKIVHDDVRKLRDVIVAAARGELAGILDGVKKGGKAPTSARARAVADAAEALPAKTRDTLLSGGARLVGSNVAVPRRVTSLAALIGDPKPTAAASTPASTLTLRVQKIRCVSDTREVLKDEILLGGQATVIPLTGDGTFGAPTDAGTTAPIALGKFKSGDTRSLDLALSKFGLRDPAPFPRVFNVSMLLIEKDFGDPAKLVTFLKAVQALIEDKVVEKVQEFLNDLDDEQKFTALIALAVTLVPSALGLLIDAVGKLVGDEAFPLFAAAVAMEAPTSLFEGGRKDTAEQVATFSAFGGTYQVTFDFALS